MAERGGWIREGQRGRPPGKVVDGVHSVVEHDHPNDRVPSRQLGLEPFGVWLRLGDGCIFVVERLILDLEVAESLLNVAVKNLSVVAAAG